MTSGVGGDELDAVVAFIAGQQGERERRVTYVGTEAAGIAAELGGLEPPWASTVRVLRDGARVTGVVLVEWDEELGRAWILGPWVDGDGDGWSARATDLLDAALAQLPDSITRRELSGDVSNQRLAALAASRGWPAGEPNHLLTIGADGVAAWPVEGDVVLRDAGLADVDAIAVLHDAEFPATYATATQLVGGPALVLVADDGKGGVAGYAAGQVHDDGEGFIDFVVVDPGARGTGVGRQLIVALTRQLLGRSSLGRVALLVQDHRLPARALYRQLGFREEESLVAYRSWEPM